MDFFLFLFKEHTKRSQSNYRKYIYKYITTVTSWSRKVGVFPLKNTIRYIT